MKPSKIISLSAVTTAFSVVFLALGAYIDVFDLSGLFLSTLCIMIPLAKKSVKCAIFSYVATSIITLFISLGTGKFSLLILYLAFFGLHPIINYLETEKNWNKILLTVLKDVWFVGALLLMYFVFNLFVDVPTFVKDYALIIIIVGGAICFILYDFIIKRFQLLTNQLIKRLKL